MRVVLPEGVPDSNQPSRRRRSSIIFGVAALALAFGAIVLGALTAPPPEAAPESTTSTSAEDIEEPIDFENFTVSEIERGAPLEWSQVQSVDDAYPLALFDHDGWIYLFATDGPSFWGYDGGGLQTWRSQDGRDWESLGQVIDDSRSVMSVASTSQGLIAVEPGRSGDGMTLWRSVDGVAWEPEVIEIDGLTENMVVYPYVIGGNEQILVVTGRTTIDAQRLIQETMTRVFGHDMSSASLSWGTQSSGEEIQIVIWGPLGFPLVEVPASDLGLSAEEMALFETEYRAPEPAVDVWVSADDGEWHRSEIEDAHWISSITTTAGGGEVIVTGWDTQGSRIWTSVDGFNWEQRSLGLGPERVEGWGGLLVGPSRSGLPSVVTSEDGITWESIGPEEHFPGSGIISWNMGIFAAGAGGIAAAVDGWMTTAGDPIRESMTLVDGDASLTIDYATGSYSLEKGDATYRWSMSSSTPPDGVSVDPTSERVTFHDTETGEDLAAFSFDELIEAERSLWANARLDDQHQAFVFYGEDEWTVQDAADAMGDTTILLLEVTDSHVMAAVTSSRGWFSPQDSSGFEIWSAPIP
ncbi:MAG TPA: hypothetical protein VF115_14765 [Acidimicrobiia bacterium]